MKRPDKRPARQYSLKLKTSLIAVSVIVVSLSLFGWLMLSLVGRTLKKDALHTAELNAELVMRHLDDQFNYMEQAYFSVLFDSQIQNGLLDPGTDPFNRSLRENLSTVMISSNYNVFSIYIKNFSDERIYTTDFETWQDADGYGGQVQPTVFSSPTLVTQKSFNRRPVQIVSVVGQLRRDHFGEPLAWVSVNAPVNTFSSILQGAAYCPDAPILLADSGGTVVTTGKTAVSEELAARALQSGTGELLDYEGERYLVIAGETGRFQWQYRQLLPESSIFAESNQLRLVLFLLLLVCAAAVFLGLYQILNYITDPIYDLSNQVMSYRQSSQNGKWAGSFRTDRKDEFAYLYQSLQEMTDRIDHLIDEDYKAQLYRKETQLRIYRNGINPHFLYNILDSLLWTIKFGDYDRAEKILRDFSTFLHHVLNANREFTTVRSMEEELRTFCELSSFLQDDAIRWSVDIADDALPYRIPTFFVQPLAENCFKHAFAGREDGTVTITGAVEGPDLVFRVADNGTGMTAEQRDRLAAYLDTYDFNREKAHFGLASVHQRLKLYYGEEYGLDIRTAPGAGTTITLRLPLDNLEKEVC